jgi:hypothetical protein
MANDKSWEKIFRDYNIGKHNFDESPFFITADDIKKSCHDFKRTGEKEARILCKQDTRDSRPEVFKKLGLFILPIQNGRYAIIEGEGYVDIPKIDTDAVDYTSKMQFELDTSIVGDSEMQHIDFAYASSLIRTFIGDSTLVLTIRGRKFTPNFNFSTGKHTVSVTSVQTEIDAGYEGADNVVLIEAKNTKSSNVIIRQLYYPYRQWQSQTKKRVATVFFQHNQKDNTISLWQFTFADAMSYNSIQLAKSGKFRIITST